MVQPVDRSILQEIVRIVEARRKVPARVQVRAREYLITYLEDHQRRLQEALQRYDSDRLNMLYGQLASKVKYQMLRRIPGGMAGGAKRAPAAKRLGGKKSASAKPARKATGSAAKSAGKSKRAPAKKTTARVARGTTKKTSARKTAVKKSVAKKAAVTRAAAKKKK